MELLPEVIVRGLSEGQPVSGLPEEQIKSGLLEVAQPTANSKVYIAPNFAKRFHVDKMSFAARDRKDIIIVNPYITVENIPARAYEYIVNGKSAIKWVMERYQVKTGKESGIVNDPNLYTKESAQPMYIIKLLRE